MKTYKANIVCSTAKDAKGVPTNRIKYMVHFGTELDIPIEEVKQDHELFNKVITACGQSLYDKYFKMENMELLTDNVDSLSQEWQDRIEKFIEINRVNYEQELIHA
jgi:hypothetical protein